MSGQSGGRIRLSKLNDQLTCKLCRGYFIDATTIIECLHSFCRSCIVKYLETTKYCPICEVQVHKSKPLLNIRPDHTLQDIVYKLVPGCYQNEMRCRREFYEMHPEAQLSSMSPEARGEPIESHIYSPDESLSLSLEYYNPNVNEGAVIPMDDSKESVAMIALTAASLAAMPGNITTVAGMTTSITNTITTTTTTTTTITSTSGTTTITGKLLPRRYLRCPAAVTVFHLQKLIRAKYGLSDAHRVDVMYKEESLCGNYTLMDVMYIYHWRRKVPLHLSYRIFESSPKRLKLSDDNTHFKESLTNAGISSVEPKDENLKREWKEVQLKISETGVMSVTGITSPESKKVPVSESLEDDQRRLDESVAAVVMTDKKLTNNTKELASQQSISDLNSKNHDEQRQQQQTQRNSEKFNDNQTDTRKNTTTTSSATTTTTKPPTEAKPVTTTTTATTTTNNNNNNNSNSNNNNNNNNSNNYNSTHEPASKLDTREKHKNTTASDTKNYQLPSGSGSKIDALSVKLQFQPKVGQVNNTYSKKTSKDKTMLEKVLKKSDSKNLFKDGQMEIKNISDKNRAICRTSGVCTSSKSSTNFQSKITIGQSQCTISSTSIDTPNTNTITSTYSTISTPSVSISITSQKNLSPDRNKESTGSSHLLSGNLHKCRKGSGENTESSNQRSISNQITNTPSSSGGGKSGFVRQNNNPTLNSESLANIGLNVSTAFLGLGSSSSGSSSTFPYTVQDLVNNAMLKSPSKNVGSTCGQKQSGISGSISVSAASHQVSTPSSLQFNIQTPSMSVYSIPNTTKNNTNANSNSNNSNNMKGNSKANLEITTAYSVPPCPDAIPISMMKPTIRKTEIIAKGTNINDICAKIGTSGSKINDICAKIGESSKEKNKTDTRLRPEIPDLLKITKKPISSMNTNDNTVMKHIPNIPNVPIYTPSNNVSSSDTRAIYMNKDTSKIMSMTTATPVTVTAMTATATTTTITATTTTANNATVTTITTTSAITSMTNTPTTTTMTTGSSTSGTTILSSSSSSSSSTISSGTVTTITPSTSSFHHVSGRGNSMKRSQSQSVGYKTLRDPPKSWNPTLSKNNYVAAKNQAKEQQNQLQPSSLMSEVSGSDGNNGGKNSIGSKPAKIFKMRNMPRYLGNPASGVKPMYGLNNEGKDNKEQTITSTASPTTSKNNVTSGLSMTKIDPKTLSPIISTNTNSPIVSPPPYSPNARSYQNTPFSRSGNSPLSPRNSPVNMLSTNPFIPSPTPNTNPRLIYSHFLPFPDGSRFANPLIRSPIGIPPPSAFHSSLPPSINKLYQRSSYMPQTTCATYAQQQGLTTQPPTVQRIPPSTHSSSSSSSSSSTSTSSSSSSSSPKSPKTTVTSSTFNLAKTETQTSIPTSLDINNVHTAKNQTDQDSNAFNLCKIPPVTTGGTSQSNYVSDLSKTSTCNVDTVKQSENDDKVSGEGENVNKNNDQIDDDGKKNVAVKDKNKAEDDTRINNEEKEQKHDQKDKMAEVKKNKKNKRKDKIILKEINIKRQLRDSHCTTGTDVKNPLSKNSNNESQMARENDDNAASNVNDQSSSITKENPTARPPNSNLSDTKNISSNQHQTVTVDNNSTDELKDNNTTESKNTLVDDVFPKIVNDNNEKDSGNPEREELMKNEKHVQSKISEIQISKAES